MYWHWQNSTNWKKYSPAPSWGSACYSLWHWFVVITQLAPWQITSSPWVLKSKLYRFMCRLYVVLTKYSPMSVLHETGNQTLLIWMKTCESSRFKTFGAWRMFSSSFVFVSFLSYLWAKVKSLHKLSFALWHDLFTFTKSIYVCFHLCTFSVS